MNKTCVIVGAGEVSEREIRVDEGDYVIAADGGLKYLSDRGIKADMVLGDFDSLGYVPDHNNRILHPAEKDDSDMMLAVKEGLQLGLDRFRIYGALGGRPDHTIANLQTLIYLAKQGAAGELIGDGVHITAIHNGAVRLGPEHKGYISVFCLSGAATGVWIKGLKYSMEDGVLTSDRPLGLSNEFVGTESEIGVREGELVILWYQ